MLNLEGQSTEGQSAEGQSADGQSAEFSRFGSIVFCTFFIFKQMISLRPSVWEEEISCVITIFFVIFCIIFA